MTGARFCRILALACFSILSAAASAGNYPNITWYLATIEDISVELSVPEELAGESDDVRWTAEQIAEYFEKFDIKEVPTSEHKFRLEISYERLSEDRCRFTVKSEFVRPTTFRRRSQVDWTESDFVRGGCDSDGLWDALDAGAKHALKLISDRNDARYQSSHAGAENAEALGRTLGCALGGGGDCTEEQESNSRSSIREAQSGAEECSFDTQCRVGEQCVKSSQYSKGICAKLKRGAESVRCQFNTDCDTGFYCHKSSGSMYGVCLKK